MDSFKDLLKMQELYILGVSGGIIRHDESSWLPNNRMSRQLSFT